jgi:hypothetical protein
MVVAQLREASRMGGVAMFDVLATAAGAAALVHSRSSLSPALPKATLLALYVVWAFMTGFIAHDWFGIDTVWNRWVARQLA